MWDKKNWEFFINDIQDSETVNGESHFLGSIITINDKDSDYIDVVDGQQRLTTISLALIALSKITSEMENIPNEIKNKFYRMCTYISDFVVIEEEIPRLHPSHQKNDYQNYIALLQEVGLLQNKSQDKKLEQESNINKSYEYFYKRFQSFKLNELMNFYEKLNITNCFN